MSAAQHTPGPMPQRLIALSGRINMQLDWNHEGRRTLEEAAEQHEALLAALRRTNALLFMRTTAKDAEALDAIQQGRAAIAKAAGSAA